MAERDVDGSHTADLIEEVYTDLRAIAAGFLANERAGHTLQPTALVHEAWARLERQRRAKWNDANHFRAVAATVMRRVLVGHASRRNAVKRGGGRPFAAYGPVESQAQGDPVDILTLDEALDKLASMDERQARIVELRFFGGLTYEQVSEVTGIPVRTIEREWRSARVWLHAEILGRSGPG